MIKNKPCRETQKQQQQLEKIKMFGQCGTFLVARAQHMFHLERQYLIKIVIVEIHRYVTAQGYFADKILCRYGSEQ